MLLFNAGAFQMRRRMSYRNVDLLIYLLVVPYICIVMLLQQMSPTVNRETQQTMNQHNSTDRHNELGHCRQAITYHPFVPNSPKLVVILTYQRSGSTFFGQLFNTDPGVFYTYEPVDSLYTSMYGTEGINTVPYDITNHKNGSERTLPQEELDEVSVFLQSILTCDVSKIPTQTFVGEALWWTKLLDPIDGYLRCLTGTHLKNIRTCQTILSEFCGMRFNSKPESRHRECFHILSNKERNKSFHLSEKTMNSFRASYLCWNHVRRLLQRTCLSKFKQGCSSRSVRVTKVVRVTMASVEPLLVQFPNFRVIHLLRDPRAVVLSRENFDRNVAVGAYSLQYRNESLIREARLYCQTVVRDIKHRRKLENVFPGKIFSLYYNKLASDLPGQAAKIFKFLDHVPSNKTLSWIRENETDRRDIIKITNKCKDNISVTTSEDVVEICKELFKHV